MENTQTTEGVVTVFNLGTGEYGPTYVGISPRRAVICAYAQSKGDYNTWDYEARYGALVREGRSVVTCGDFTTSTEPGVDET